MIKSKNLIIGILAHVDAGKTTLVESLLYLSGSIRTLGRVDHKDAFLDTYELERARGITIFSKQAELELGDKSVTLLDTPGHVDFSAEMERTLQVLDYAILVISGADGVQGHVETLWRLLHRYDIPVFLFINKMDQDGTDREQLLQELKKKLDERCLEFGDSQKQDSFMENIAMCEERLLETYLESGSITKEDIISLIEQRKVFPCFFGSALKVNGIAEFLQGIEEYTKYPEYPEDFGAKVYKISRDSQGNRLTHLKITGGGLKVKTALTNRRGANSKDNTASNKDNTANSRANTMNSKDSTANNKANTANGNNIWEEKVDQIRIYSGAGFRSVNEVKPGCICTVTGLTKTHSGEGLGIEEVSDMPVLEPVLLYRIQLPLDRDVHDMYIKLRQLEEEEPQLHIVWDENLNEIHAQVMGEVQIEILKSMILERFGVNVEFGAGSIVYKETILEPVEGVGHYEPLRHYAEVHLLLEPGEQGSGLQFECSCSEDILDRNWQRLIVSHLEEKQHRGVLTGSEITDMKITLVTGRAHLKHTEGGDFRQATYRAVRHGLKKAKSVLLEPIYEFRLELPSEMVGRAMSDIQKMHGRFAPPQLDGAVSILTGFAPVVTMRGYQTEVISYTRGCGRLSCWLSGYEPCHNAQEIIEVREYDSEKDLDNPTASVFCSHGAGFLVGWSRVEDYMHVESYLKLDKVPEIEMSEEVVRVPKSSSAPMTWNDEKELEEIFVRTYGSTKREVRRVAKSITYGTKEEQAIIPKKIEAKDVYLLVDGYNIIFAWEELKELAEVNVESARNKLMDILSNYQGFKKMNLILVFDAYKVKGNQGEVQKVNNIHVVYTKEAETADQYIEKVVHEIGRKYNVTVATSDALEQMIIFGQGARRLSALGLKEEVEAANVEIRSNYLEKQRGSKNYLSEHFPENLSDLSDSTGKR